jgi:hypothetical protein
MMELEKSLTETLGTRVVIENRPNGGRVLIEFFSPEDLSNIVSSIAAQQESHALEMLQASTGGASGEAQVPDQAEVVVIEADNSASEQDIRDEELAIEEVTEVTNPEIEISVPVERAPEIFVPEPLEENLYSVKNFSI